MMPVYAYRAEDMGHVADIRGESDSRPLHDENPEVILATAALGVFTELAGALLAFEQPQK